MASTVASNVDIAKVWVKFKEDTSNVDLRNFLIERYMHLVRFNGERLRAKLPEGVELDDLISAGIFGLMDAIDAFDLSPVSVVPCSTSSGRWIGYPVWCVAKPANSTKRLNYLKPSTVELQLIMSFPIIWESPLTNWRR